MAFSVGFIAKNSYFPCQVTGRQIDRLLKPTLRLRGISGTKRAANALLKKIPVRVPYTDTERSTPGFWQIDTGGLKSLCVY